MLLTEQEAREKWCPEARVLIMGKGEDTEASLVAANRLHGMDQ